MHEPAYPIFFPTYTPSPTGYARDWWWYDPELQDEDTGPFDSRSEAVSDWAWHHFSACLLEDARVLDLALESPLVRMAQPQEISQVMPELRRSMSEQQQMAETGFMLVAQLEAMQESTLMEVGA